MAVSVNIAKWTLPIKFILSNDCCQFMTAPCGREAEAAGLMVLQCSSSLQVIDSAKCPGPWLLHNGPIDHNTESLAGSVNKTSWLFFEISLSVNLDVLLAGVCYFVTAKKFCILTAKANFTFLSFLQSYFNDH